MPDRDHATTTPIQWVTVIPIAVRPRDRWHRRALAIASDENPDHERAKRVAVIIALACALLLVATQLWVNRHGVTVYSDIDTRWDRVSMQLPLYVVSNYTKHIAQEDNERGAIRSGLLHTPTARSKRESEGQKKTTIAVPCSACGGDDLRTSEPTDACPKCQGRTVSPAALTAERDAHRAACPRCGGVNRPGTVTAGTFTCAACGAVSRPIAARRESTYVTVHMNDRGEYVDDDGNAHAADIGAEREAPPPGLFALAHGSYAIDLDKASRTYGWLMRRGPERGQCRR